MTESQWLKAADGDALLAAVQDRLSPRKWSLLACAVVRRLWDLIPDGPYRDAIRFREDQANEIASSADFTPWVQRLADALPDAMDAAEARQRAVVATCDPGADRNAFQDTGGRRINPAVPLFRSASGTADNAIDSAGAAVRIAADAVRLLFTETGLLRLNHVRRFVIDALVRQANAGGYAALALEYKAKGDEMADLGQVKNPRMRQAEAEETVRRLGDNSALRLGNLDEQKSKVDRKLLGKLLLEQLGNPFQSYRFEDRWRTEPVIGIARAIDEDRAFERYPILLDALLDADCDDEAILRHVRGTEPHHPNPTHGVGCWVIDLILRKDEAVFSHSPPKGASASGPGVQLGLAPLPQVQSGLFDGEA